MKSALLAITAYLIFGISLPVCSEEAWLQGASMIFGGFKAVVSLPG